MTWRDYVLLFVLAIIPPLILARFQAVPGYLDSDYYYAGGIQLASGHGFNEPYLWNYLDGTTSLPHPSHSYWMPLASIIAAIAMYLGHSTSYAAARVPFILLAAACAPLTAGLAYKFSGSRALAWTSGLLAIFSVYHAPFVGVTDNFSPFIFFGGLYFLTVSRLMESPLRLRSWFALGLIAGLLALARTDGLLWLPMTILLAALINRSDLTGMKIGATARASLVALAGFLFIMSPWYARNLIAFGQLMAPGGSRALWLANYDQTFIYPPDQLSPRYFLSLGAAGILLPRLGALKLNLESAFAAHGGILLFPFIVIGIFAHRRDVRVRLNVIAWSILFVVMTIVFPFAGARGAFFHAGAALQPMWWTLAPLGLDSLLAWLRARGWGTEQARIVFRAALVLIAALLTVFVVYLRLFKLGWGEGEASYPAMQQFLLEHGLRSEDTVIVRNAPGFYFETKLSAVSIPYGDERTILAVAHQFGARYLILEPSAALPPLQDLLNDPVGHAHFNYLGEIDDARIFQLDTK